MQRESEYVHRHGAPSRRYQQKKSGPPPIIILALVLILVIVAAVLIVFFVRGSGQGESSSVSSPSSALSSNEASQPSSSLPDTSSDLSSTPSVPDNTAATPPPEKVPEGDPEMLNSLLRIGDTAYELYNFSEDLANEYITTVCNLNSALGGSIQLYDMVIPTSIDITLPEDYIEQHQINSQDQKKAINYIYSSINTIDPGVKTVPIYDALKLHNNEYLYFRTDHHWTQLGAYYAYAELCKTKGITPLSLGDYEKAEYPGYLGSFYNNIPNSAMENNPDTVEAYRSGADTSLYALQNDGTALTDWPVIQDGSTYSTSNKYLIFCAADQPYEELTNSDITDGSACILLKESFGNCFAPFLADHYQTVYVVDYRHYTGNVATLAQEKNVSDVFLLSNISMTRNSGLIEQLGNSF